jgi:hypothetical protein
MQMLRICWEECQNNAASESPAHLEDVAEDGSPSAMTKDLDSSADEDDWVFVDRDASD